MSTEERVRRIIKIFRESGPGADLDLTIQKLKEEDPLAHAVVNVYMHAIRYRHSAVVAKGKRLLNRVRNSPWLVWRLLVWIAWAQRNMGETETAESSFLRALEIAKDTGDDEGLSETKLWIYTNMFFRAEYGQAMQGFRSFRNLSKTWEACWGSYLWGLCALVKGKPSEAIKAFESSMAIGREHLLYFDALEAKALATRVMGSLAEALEGFWESANGFLEHGTSYPCFPLAKALEISRLAGLGQPPQKVIRKALSAAKKGSWGEQAAAQEIGALLLENDAEAAEGLMEAARNYLRAHQNIEAVLSGLTAAYLAWSSDSPVFTKALKLVAPLVPLHPGFKGDPLLGDFIATTEPLMNSLLQKTNTEGIKAYLIGEFKVLVNGREIELTGWWRKKAIKAFVYLLLSPKHRIPVDHLFYLLWPRRSYKRRNLYSLYSAISTIRKHLGRRDLIRQSRDFYQLEDVWTDLSELENLVRLADATDDPVQKEEYLSRARELARGELLPEFPYDRHIDEYRQHYKRLRKKLGLE